MEKSTQVTLSGVEKKDILYLNADPGSSRQVEADTPHGIPIGTVVRQRVTLLTEVTTSDGKKLPGLNGFLLESGPQEFLRGRLVTPPHGAVEEGPLIAEMEELRVMGVEVLVIGGRRKKPIVEVLRADGSRAEFRFVEGSIPPPKDASPYAVGESPEELAASVGATPTDEERRFCPDCLADTHPVDPEVALTAAEAAQERVERGAGMGGGADAEFVGDGALLGSLDEAVIEAEEQ